MSHNEEVIDLLRTAYMMELETVENYLANSVYLDGIHAETIKASLARDVAEEFSHASRLARRIKELGGRVPGSLELERSQATLQPPESSTDVDAVISGVIEAEQMAIEQYRKVIRATDDEDYVTQEMAISILAEEESHLVLFEGFRAGCQHAAMHH